MRINIDSGHGANTAGKRTPPMPFDIDIEGDGKVDIKKNGQYMEHYANVGVAVLLVAELKRCGFETTQTGFDDDNPADDIDVALSIRQNAIAKTKCDYSISIHFNAFGDGTSFNSGEGVGIYIHNKYPGESEVLAQVVIKHLAGGSKQKNRGIKKKDLAICNCNALATKGAILCELAFMTNEVEATKYMSNKEFWKESAREICKGLCEYTGIKYVEEVYVPTTTITPASSSKDIKWLQEQLNQVLPVLAGIVPLKVDGNYGPITRIAVLLYWNRLGWGKSLKDDGTKIGEATRKALATGKTK